MSETFRHVEGWPRSNEEVSIVLWGDGWYVVFFHDPATEHCCLWCDNPPLKVGTELLLQPDGPGRYRMVGVGEPNWDGKVVGIVEGADPTAPWVEGP